MVGVYIPQQHRWSVDGIVYRTDLAGVEPAPERSAASRNRHRQPCARDWRNVFKSAFLSDSIGHVVKEQRPFCEGGAPVVLVYLGIDVAIGHEPIEPAIVVIVDEAVTPANKRNCGLRDPGVKADIGEAGFAIIVIENFVVVAKVSDEKVDQPVVFVIACGNAHGGDLASVFVERES